MEQEGEQVADLRFIERIEQAGGHEGDAADHQVLHVGPLHDDLLAIRADHAQSLGGLCADEANQWLAVFLPDVEGDVIDLKLRLDNNTDFTGKKLTAKTALVETAAYAKTSINISGNATIDASGSSEIELFGEPKIDIKRFTESAMIKKRPLKN